MTENMNYYLLVKLFFIQQCIINDH